MEHAAKAASAATRSVAKHGVKVLGPVAAAAAFAGYRSRGIGLGESAVRASLQGGVGGVAASGAAALSAKPCGLTTGPLAPVCIGGAAVAGGILGSDLGAYAGNRVFGRTVQQSIDAVRYPHGYWDVMDIIYCRTASQATCVA